MDSSHPKIPSQPGFKWIEVKSALATLPLKYVTFEGYHIFIVSDQIDSTIEGEPYLGLQLWFSLKTGRVISRIWGQTVACQKVANVSQFVETCKAHFQGRPCIGYPDVGQELQPFLISQTPIPRRISATCQGPNSIEFEFWLENPLVVCYPPH